MPSSFIAYIDESGCDGFRQGAGSSDWLVFAAAVFRTQREPQSVQVVDRVRAELNRPPNKDLHFTDLHHSQRVVYVSRVAATSMRCIVIAVHKPSLLDKGTFQVKNRLYHFGCRLLVERISWLCAAHRQDDGGDGGVELVFSHRRTISYDDIKNYLRTLQRQGTEIDWTTIDPDRVRALPHRQLKGLWIADCVASSFYQGLELNAHGFTEGRYAATLRPIVWGKNDIFAGAGIKIYPREAMQVLDLDGQHEWLRIKYGIGAT
ncbi:MAG: DUF3800 domain-containing protein [Pirellulales bacterium]